LEFFKGLFGFPRGGTEEGGQLVFHFVQLGELMCSFCAIGEILSALWVGFVGP
jgi:hypothetical protein